MSRASEALAVVAALMGDVPPSRQLTVVRPSEELEGAARTQAVWELHFHVRRKTGQGIALRAYSKRS